MALSASKARTMLHDKTAHGRPLTDQQRKYFGAVASGSASGDHPRKKIRSKSRRARGRRR